MASCTRVSMPSTPPIAKNMKAVIMKRRPMTVWLTAARRCSPGPVAQIAASWRWSRSAGLPGGVCSTDALIASPSTMRRPWRARRGSPLPRWTMTANPIPVWPTPQNSVALSLVSAGFVGLDAQDVRVSRHGIDLAGKAWNPEGVDDVDAADRDVHGYPAGGAGHPGRHTAFAGIAEGPAPLPALGLDPLRGGPRQRQKPLAHDQRIGDERRQDHGRQDEATEHEPACRRHARAPAGPPDHQTRTGPAPARTARRHRPA